MNLYGLRVFLLKITLQVASQLTALPVIASHVQYHMAYENVQVREALVTGSICAVWRVP